MLSKKIEKAFNEQLNAELNSSYVYLALATYFAEKNLDGFAHWMKVQAKEEVEHAMKFYGYIISRGGRVVLGKIDAPKSDWPSPLEGFKTALDHERMITGRINDLVALAGKEDDHASHQFLMWFVAEQVEEEDSVGRVVERLKLVGDSPNGLLMMDHTLGQRARG
ncbi:MAG: ferritin [Acidobacteriota bacterium]